MGPFSSLQFGHTLLASGVRCNLYRCFLKHWIPTRWCTQSCGPESNL